MNFVALFGVIDKINKNEQNETIITIQVEKSFVAEEEQKEDFIDVVVNNNFFSNEIKILTKKSLVGIKGRIENINHKLYVVCERIHLIEKK